MKRLDSISFELLKNNIEALVDEMTLTMVRTAYSTNIRDGMDFSTAMCDAKGETVAQGLCLALHLGSIPDAIEAVLKKFGNRLHPGDVYIMNDPYTGGMHLPDIFLFKPVFSQETLLGFLVIVGDHVDIGGQTPGGRSLKSTEVYQEGLRIPPALFMDQGRPVEAVWDIIAQNVRLAPLVLGDLRSCLAAFHSAEGLLMETVEKFGVETVRDFFAEVLDYTERLTRQALNQIPDGHYEFTDYIDDSVVKDDPLPIKVALDVRGDELYFDFTGSAAQVPAAINATFSFTKSACYAAVRPLMPADLPNNGGFFRPIHVSAPLGTILNPREPAPVASRGVTGARAIDAAMGVLAQALPDRVPAAGEGGTTSVRIGGYDDQGKAFIVFDSVVGTWGALPFGDGMDGCSAFRGSLSNVPVEVIESEAPIRIHRYGLRQDSGGPGLHRGGLGLQREWELLCDQAIMTIRADRTKFQPWGLQGGKPGAPSINTLNPMDAARRLPAKMHYDLKKGERILHQQAAGGGYGNPLLREPERVFWDWKNEKVSTEHAREAYGVVIDVSGKCVDLAATAALRAELDASARHQNK